MEHPKIVCAYKNSLELRRERYNPAIKNVAEKTSYPLVVISYQGNYHHITNDDLFGDNSIKDTYVKKWFDSNIIKFRELFRHLSGCTTLREVKSIVGDNIVEEV